MSKTWFFVAVLTRLVLAQTPEHPPHVESVSGFPGLKVESTFASDAGYQPTTYLFEGRRLPPETTAEVVLPSFGWTNAGAAKKRQLAQAWLKNVVHAEGLEHAPAGLPAAEAKLFHAPRLTVASDGSARWTAWSSWSSAMAQRRGFSEACYTFDPGGRLTRKELHSVTLPDN